MPLGRILMKRLILLFKFIRYFGIIYFGMVVKRSRLFGKTLTTAPFRNDLVLASTDSFSCEWFHNFVALQPQCDNQTYS